MKRKSKNYFKWECPNCGMVIKNQTPELEGFGILDCSKCGNEMSEGFIFDGSDPYCSEECLSDVATPQEWCKLHKEEPDYFYWTQWEETDIR